MRNKVLDDFLMGIWLLCFTLFFLVGAICVGLYVAGLEDARLRAVEVLWWVIGIGVGDLLLAMVLTYCGIIRRRK